ncbi:colicin transporter [Pseudomonas marginalis ICMP 9505]|uniref:Bacteriocin immunity protein n=1 Tax=Pseudomonas kitaguniensis TaxID=2607908 RepID=A0A5N7KL71_9PSED|nr:bacteriocin immunity protein [Pseudomonas kitaguniensis]KTC21986.1 colicin transporter [Pseudomonas marginalis ICMP 9505]MPR02889.1 bacteriocin immunity protein [Pseudomonas kitaguniensis]
MSDPFIKNSLPDYTEEEFVSFIDEIRKEDKASTDDRADELVLHLNKIAGHPGGMDLIYYPELGADTSSAGIVKTIKEWRAAHGLPGFKE